MALDGSGGGACLVGWMVQVVMLSWSHLTPKAPQLPQKYSRIERENSTFNEGKKMAIFGTSMGETGD